tara:strand:- start:507 stop:1880 length:1374 start_codon:yes stop_codon:yes gene_type:complete
MSNEGNEFDFENEILSFKSNVNDFTKSIFNDLDSISKDIQLEKKINDLFYGEKVNYTENKAALHVLHRRELEDLGLFTITPELHHKLESNSGSPKIKNIVVLGIGGSFEGPKLLLESLTSQKTSFRFEFITGSDPFEFEYKTKDIKPDETLFIVSSKSFTTDETLVSLKEAIKWSGDTDNFIAITANKEGALRYNISKDLIFELHDEIGGRYSIWSYICLPAYIEFKYGKSGIQGEYDDHGARPLEEIEMFVRGARDADKDLIENEDYLKFVKTLSYSDIWLNNNQSVHSRAVLSYCWRLRSFADYVQQLEMESLGKQPNKDSNFKNTGQIIFGGYGPTAQHSYFQLLHQGTQNVAADIIAFKEDSTTLAYAQAITQSRLLSNGTKSTLKDEERINGNVPINLFLFNQLDPYTLGYLMATWEHRTFITAAMFEINPFDQFGVQAGKDSTKKFIKDNQ